MSSALLYTLAYNLTFFIQELFLVLPKALTPGLRPTLFHNNHTWEGENPLASLFQGTGALAILTSGTICGWLLRRSWRSITVRLFLIWMTYNGLYQALPQVVIGAISPRSDAGMAITYLGLGEAARTAAALTALSLIGIVWMQALAWRAGVVSWRGATRASIGYPLAAAVALLLVFQLLLRRGVAFY